MAQGKDPNTGQMRETRANEAVDPKSGLIYTISSSKGCKDGGLPIGLPLKGYTQFRPIGVVEAGKTLYHHTTPPKEVPVIQYQFQADGDIVEWQLKKACHWILTIGIGFGYVPTGGLLGSVGFGVGSAVSANGTFEYKIVSPGGQVIFWSRVNLSLMGATLQDAYTLFLTPDRSVDFRTRLFTTPPVVGSPLPKPPKPVLTPITNANGFPNGGVRITYKGKLPVSVTKLFVERAIPPDDPNDKEGHRNVVWSRLGSTPMEESNDGGTFTKIDLQATAGKHYFYRLRYESDEGGFNLGDGLSIYVVSNKTGRTIIETYVIDGKPTVNHPDPNIGAEERLSYDEYAPTHIVWPKGREETMFLCPPEVLGQGFLDIPLDFDWYGPTYKMKIPNGSILQLIMDGTSFGTFTKRGRAAEWQFSYKTETILWGVITDVVGRLLSTAPEGSGAAFITAENVNSRDTIQTNRAHILFNKGASAFVLKSGNGTVEVFIDEEGKTKVYISTNGGKTFDIRKNVDGTDFTIFESDPHKLIDVTRDADHVSYLLTETGDSIFVTTSEADYDNKIYIGPKDGNKFRFELSGSEFGAPGLSIIGGGKRYVSDNRGLSWTTRAVIQG